MTMYGYLINLNYTPNDGDVLWDFERYEAEGVATQYKGIEGFDLVTCEDYVIIGNSQEFMEWLNTGFEPQIELS